MDHPTPTPEQNAIEAAAFRRLLEHLDSHRDVQNIDLMNLAGFCRNCLSRWYREAAEAGGAPLKTALLGSGCTACPMRCGSGTSKG